jgi:hypothetical protein
MRTWTEWSKEQEERTRDVLERVDIVAFSFSLTGKKKGCPLNHLSGRDGYITLSDALGGDWRVFDDETDSLLETYGSISGVVEGGWKVST